MKSGVIVIIPNQEDRHLASKTIDEELEIFDKWFQKLQNDPLIPSEKAIIKTFLYYEMYHKTKENHG